SNPSFIDDPLYGKKTSVPAAVMVHCKYLVLLFCKFYKGVCFFGSSGKGLIYNNMFARRERFMGHFKVQPVGHRNDHQIDLLVSEEIIEVFYYRNPGILLFGTLGLTLHYF